MPLTLTYDNPDFPDGHEFSLPGGVLVLNRKPTELSDEQERNFVMEMRSTVKDAFSDEDYVKVEGTTAVQGGVKTAFGGIDPNEEGVISDSAPHDPTAMNLVDGKPFAGANLSGVVSAPDEPEEAPVAQAPVVVDEKLPNANT